MLQLYLAALGAVVVANIIAVVAIAATTRRNLTRFRRCPDGEVLADEVLADKGLSLGRQTEAQAWTLRHFSSSYWLSWFCLVAATMVGDAGGEAERAPLDPRLFIPEAALVDALFQWQSLIADGDQPS
jgi:hypothetical protein